MRLFFIDIPEVSKGLRRTYYKNLEVFAGSLDEETDKVVADTVYKYNSKKDEWVEKPFNRYEYRYVDLGAAQDQMPPLDKMKHNTIYTSLELAQAAKLILVEDMARTYEAALRELQEQFDRNVPNVSKPLQALKDQYPEYFI